MEKKFTVGGGGGGRWVGGLESRVGQVIVNTSKIVVRLVVMWSVEKSWVN